MAASFYSLVVSAFGKDASASQAVTELAKKAVRTAYSRPDGLVMVQTMLDHMTKHYRSSLPRFFKLAGFTLDMTPGKPIIVQILDKSKQAKVFAWLETAVVVNPEDVIIQPKTKKPTPGTWVEQAQKSVERFVASQKKASPEVGAIVNQMIQRPTWFVEMAALAISDEEAAEIIKAVVASRMASAPSLLKLAA